VPNSAKWIATPRIEAIVHRHRFSVKQNPFKLPPLRRTQIPRCPAAGLSLW
jgi:hypothetical protein